ncbi:Putative GTP-binding protein (plasmid) [Candidatus Megaera polyxenophila]|nr:Putative GTP-binding protein [Candidatus Megaera polyxenophila]
MKQHEYMGEKETSNSSSINISKLQWLIKSGYANISNNKIEQSVLVVGDTGNGKSTLVNALTDKRLESHFVKKGMKGSYVINLSSDEQGATIGATAVSETTIPKSWFDQKSKIVYWDCPGFEDTKGVEQDIANGFFIKQIFDNSEMVKILLVTSENQITSDRCAVFLRLTQKLASMFKDIDKVAGGISLVVTKAGEGVDPQGVREELMLVKKDHESSKESSTFKDPNLKKLFDTIISPKSKIGIFYTPTKEGLLSKNLEFCKSIVNIKDAVNGSSYIYKPEINIPISDKSKVAIHNVYDFEKQEASLYSKQLKQTVENYIEVNSKDLSIGLPKMGNLSKLFQKLFQIKPRVDELDSLNDYSSLMQEISNVIEWKKNLSLEQEFSWLDISERKAEIEKLTKEQIENILSQNNFTPIIETVKFCKSILKTQDKLSDYAYKDFNEINRAIDDRILEHKQILPDGLYTKFSNLILNLNNIIELMVKENKSTELIKVKKALESIMFLKGENYIYKLLDICKSIGIKEDELAEIKKSLSDILKINENLHGINKIDLRSDSYASDINQMVNKLLRSEDELKQKSLQLEQHIKEKILLQPQEYIVKNTQSIISNGIKVSGNSFKVSEINKYLYEFNSKKEHSQEVYLNNGKYFVLNAINEIVFDEDIKLNGNLVCVAPMIRCSKGINIDLSGEKGKDSSSSYRADTGSWWDNESSYIGAGRSNYGKGGYDGSSGAHGNSGLPGGNIFMIAWKYVGLENMKFNLSGGNGSDGQHGGHGASCTGSYLGAPMHKNGGDGGKGGDAGKGANPGKYFVYKTNNIKQLESYDEKAPQIISNKGKHGNPGEGGDGGKAWKSMIINTADGCSGSGGEYKEELTYSNSVTNFLTPESVTNDYLNFVMNSPEEYGIQTLGEMGYEPFVSV